MSSIPTKQETIDAIVKEARKLHKLELQILLTQLRVKTLQSKGVRPVADYDAKKVKLPTLQQIDTWKHESRNNYAGR